jgi:hypothetical protein
VLTLLLILLVLALVFAGLGAFAAPAFSLGLLVVLLFFALSGGVYVRRGRRRRWRSF